jgi:hypothetical protein
LQNHDGLVLTQTKHHQNVQASQISQSHHSLASLFQVTVHIELSRWLFSTHVLRYEHSS